MSARPKKPDARALFKQAKTRKTESSSAGAGRSAPSKYQGLSKEQMLALLRAKTAGNTTGQKAAHGASIPSVEARRRASSPSPAVQVHGVKVIPKATPAAPKGQVQAGGQGLTGLLGIAAADSSDDDDDEDSDSGVGGRGVDGSSGAGEPKVAIPQVNAEPVASVPEGLPAGFFDEDVEPPASFGTADRVITGGVDEVGAGGRGEADTTPIVAAATGGFGPERAAELAAQAAVEAEADAVREVERLAALKAAGVFQAVVVAAGAPAKAEEVSAPGAEGEAAAPNGSALPEGFFDDPEVDAQSRGVDLKAKKKEEEQNDWKEFMSFAEEVKKAEKEEEQEEEAVEEDKEQYEELEQATMMGKLAVLMNKFESVGHKRRRPSSSSGGNVPGGTTESGEGSSENTTKRTKNSKGGNEYELEGRDEDETVRPPPSSEMKNKEREDVEMSVEKTGSAMREVAVASAPTDAAATDISSMLQGRKRKKKKEVEEAFAGEYVPLDPLDWRARGR